MSKGYVDLLRTLNEFKLNFLTLNAEGETAMHMSAKFGMSEVLIQTLHNIGVNVNVKNKRVCACLNRYVASYVYIFRNL